ncbi:MAG: rhomboid family intramembrane serine protease [Devosia sp.]
MSSDDNSQQNQAQAAEPSRQPIFLLPGAVLLLCGILVAIEAAKSLVLNEAGVESLLAWFSFFPYRLIEPEAVEGGWLPILWTPLTHAFLHSGWEHVLMNSVWLAIFATPLTKRYGTIPMLLLFAIGAIAGAAAFAATTLPNPAVLVGASGGVAALTGAALRFMFQPVVVAVDPETGERRVVGRRLAGIREVAMHPSARTFAIVWIIGNAIVPLLPLLTGMSVGIAWQAHLGGFFAGFLLVPLFERKSDA